MLALDSVFEGQYRVESVIGQGAHGIVYRARQLSMDRWVAIKVMTPPAPGGGEAHERWRTRLDGERLCGRLHHPSIVGLVDAGHTEAGLSYTVLEYAPGKTLRSVLAEESVLSLSEARGLMGEVLDGLSCAHRHGVLHRDLKPENIMVTQTGARRHALIVDFGTGALLAQDGTDIAPAQTSAGGTPAYAAPEQLRGLDSGPHTDIFSWGLILIECLTGRPVFSGPSSQVLFELLGPGPVPLPPELVGHPLESVVRRAVRKEASLRDHSAQDLLIALDATGGANDSPRLSPATGGAERSRTPTCERRQLTAVSCVISLPQQTTGTPDDDAVDEKASAAAEACCRIARRHGGHLAATMGNHLLFYFGHPRAAEDDASRAARAGLEMVSRSSSTDTGATDVASVQVGIHSGDMEVEDDTDPATATMRRGFGRLPGVALALAREASPDTVLASEEASLLLPATFATEPLAPRSPVRNGQFPGATRILEERQRGGREPGGAFRNTSFVGREREMDLLRERWDRARRGAGQCVLLIGEAGIGKSRLVHELLALQGTKDRLLLVATCSPADRHSPLHPVLQLLRRLLQLDDGQATADQLSRVNEKLGHLPLDIAAAATLTQMLGLAAVEGAPSTADSPAQLREHTFRALLSLFLRLADEHPLLIIVEDLQWADPSSLEFLSLLARELPSAHILAVFTARPESLPAIPTAGMHQLTLDRLMPDQCERMARQIALGTALSTEDVDWIWRRTEGVPLFVEELAGMLAGSAPPSSDPASGAAVRARSDVPRTLRGLLATKLDALGPAKATAQLAAVLGREFPFDLLAALHPGDPSEARTRLQELVEVGVLHREPSAALPTFAFRQPMVRDAAYESLPRASRRSIHAWVATTLERLFPARARARPDLMAYHHSLAGHTQQSLAYAVLACQLALERAAFSEVLHQARTALSWLSGPASEHTLAEMELNSLLSFSLLATGTDAEELRTSAERCYELAAGVPDGPRTVPALWRLILCFTHSDRVRAFRIGERLLTCARSSGDTGQLVALLSITAHCLILEAQFESARSRAREVLDLYDLDSHRRNAYQYGIDSKVHAHILLTVLHDMRADDTAAAAEAEAAVAWSRVIDHPTSLGNALMHLATVYQAQADRDRVQAVVANAFDVAERHALGFVRMFCGILQGWARRSPADAEECLAALRRSSLQAGLTYWLTVVAETHAACCQFAAALSLVDEALDHAAVTGEVYQMPKLLRLKAEYLSAAGSDGDPRPLIYVHQAIEVARRHGSRKCERRSQATLKLLLRTGEQNTALTAGAEYIPPTHKEIRT